MRTRCPASPGPQLHHAAGLGCDGRRAQRRRSQRNRFGILDRQHVAEPADHARDDEDDADHRDRWRWSPTPRSRASMPSAMTIGHAVGAGSPIGCASGSPSRQPVRSLQLAMRESDFGVIVRSRRRSVNTTTQTASTKCQYQDSTSTRSACTRCTRPRSAEQQHQRRAAADRW